MSAKWDVKEALERRGGRFEEQTSGANSPRSRNHQSSTSDVTVATQARAPERQHRRVVPEALSSPSISIRPRKPCWPTWIRSETGHTLCCGMKDRYNDCGLFVTCGTTLQDIN